VKKLTWIVLSLSPEPNGSVLNHALLLPTAAAAVLQPDANTERTAHNIMGSKKKTVMQKEFVKQTCTAAVGTERSEAEEGWVVSQHES
jgi:hypothetical protein